MAEIKFTISRMNEVYSRIDEMEEQLLNTIKADQEILNNIATNVQGDNISTILSGYAETSQTTCNNTITLLNSLKEYLASKISSYGQSDMQAQSDLSAVQTVLDQL